MKLCQVQANIAIIFRSVFKFPKITECLIDLLGDLLLLLPYESRQDIFITLKVAKYLDISNFSDICYFFLWVFVVVVF